MPSGLPPAQSALLAQALPTVCHVIGPSAFLTPSALMEQIDDMMELDFNPR